MKSICCIKNSLIVLFFSATVFVDAQQQFRAGLIGGIIGSQISGDTYAGYHQPGLYGGLFARTTLKNDILLSFEVCYSQKGSRHNPDPEKGDYSQYFLRLNYIAIPVSASFPISLAPKFKPQIGLAYNALLSYYEEVNFFNQLGIRPFKRYELSAYLGALYQINNHFEFHLRAESSILPVRDHPSGTSFRLNRGQYSATLCFAIAYQFGKE